MACTRDTNVVALYTSGLDVDTARVKVVGPDGQSIRVLVMIVPVTEILHVFTYYNLKAGNEYVLTVPFAGNITDDPAGYYRSSYVDGATNRTRYATTK